MARSMETESAAASQHSTEIDQQVREREKSVNK